MSKFENRESPTLNYKILDVKSVERDESGEIISMEVEVIRNDEEGLTQEGTPLNAESLNQVINEMIVTQIVNFMDVDQSIYIDKRDLKLNEEYSDDFLLETTGKCGSSITWNVVSGTGIEIEGNVAKVTLQNYKQTVVLRAVIEKEGETLTKDFTIDLVNHYQTVERTLSVFPDGSSAMVASFYESINEDVDVVVENEYPNMMSVYYKVNLTDMNVYISTTVGSAPTDGGVTEYVFAVLLNSKVTGLTIKKVYCKINFLDSISPDD